MSFFGGAVGLVHKRAISLLVRGWVAFIAVAQLLSSAHADVKPLSEYLSFSELVSLTQQKLGEIPELKSLWTWQASSRAEVYAAGSIIGNLLRWEWAQLKAHTLEDVRHTSPPALGDLFGKKDFDIDFFMDLDLREAVQDRLPKGLTLDFNSESVYRDLVRGGGATFEKIRMNPLVVDDPYNALLAYYQGDLVFHLAEDSEYLGLDIVAREDVSRTAEALRFMTVTLRHPELRPRPDSIEQIKKIPFLEENFILRADRACWVQWMLDRFFSATGNNIGTTLFLLRQYGLLEFLSRHAFKLPVQKSKMSEQKLVELGFSPAEIRFSKKMFFKTNFFQRVGGFVSAVKVFCFSVLGGNRWSGESRTENTP